MAYQLHVGNNHIKLMACNMLSKVFLKVSHASLVVFKSSSLVVKSMSFNLYNSLASYKKIR